MTMMPIIIVYFLSSIVSNVILFLGVADDPKVVNKLKCSIWFVCHTKVLSDDVRLQYPRRVSFEVKYFLRYVHYIPLIRHSKILFLISKLPYVHHYRLISFGLALVIVKRQTIESGLRRLTTLLRQWDTARHILLCLDFPLNQLW